VASITDDVTFYNSHGKMCEETGRKRIEPRLTAVDLFSGCGGLTVGLEAAGVRVVAAVELDRSAAHVYAQNHPDVKLLRRNIRRLSSAALMKAIDVKPGDLDLLAGCPPCQGFSTLTTRNGKHDIDDPRNDLILDFLRLAKKLKPRAVMLENVPALGREAVFAEFCRGLSAAGYRFRWQIMNVADYGVPQRRRRLILIALREGTLKFAPKAQKAPTVRSAIGALVPAGDSGDRLHDLPEHRNERIRALIEQIPRDGGSRLDLGEDRQLPCHRRSDGFKDVYGRMSWDDVAPTITSGCHNPSKGRFLHPDENRCITLREAALLQTFPARYKFPVALGKEKLALFIGNALPPEFVRRHALALAHSLINESARRRG
jgi:DNA (cytosine-5)-methyltransferase 1